MSLLRDPVRRDVVEAQMVAREALNGLLDHPTTLTIRSFREAMGSYLQCEESWLADEQGPTDIELVGQHHQVLSDAFDDVLWEVPGSQALLEKAHRLRAEFLRQIVLTQRCL